MIGALRVSLGLDSASFEQGLKNTQKGLSKWQAAAIGAFAAVTVAGIAAAGALSKAMDGAIDRFDEMGKAAQKVGVSVEALSRLQYAAELSDVSLDQLTGGLQRLSKSMADVAAGSKGPAATAFAALGVSITNAAGQLKASDEVFAEVADKFARMEDGSTKTALAIGIFGKAGADLIPLLNEGRDGLAAMAAESDRLGKTISGSAAANAEEFNDNLTRVNLAMTGVVDTITAAALPVLSYLSKAFVQAAGNGELLQSFANGFIFVLKSVVSVGAVVVTTIGAISDSLMTLLNAMRVVQTQGFDAALNVLSAGGATIRENIGATIDFINGLWAAVDAGTGEEGATKLAPFVADMDALATSTAAAEAATKALQQAQDEGLAVFEATRTPLEQLQMDLDKLGHLLNQGAIDWDTYGRAVNAATMNSAAATIGAVGQITDTIAGAFKDNKAFAVASAVVNTAEGITKALAQGGIFGFVGAAAVAAAGAAQISTILSAQKGSGSKPSVKGGSSSSAVSSPAANPAPATDAGTTINLTLKGGGRYSRNELEQLFRDMNDGLGDGMKLNVVGA